eukprot:1138446-Pelagomonas_calceolata.AAC.4
MGKLSEAVFHDAGLHVFAANRIHVIRLGDHSQVKQTVFGVLHDLELHPEDELCIASGQTHEQLEQAKPVDKQGQVGMVVLKRKKPMPAKKATCIRKGKQGQVVVPLFLLEDQFGKMHESAFYQLKACWPHQNGIALHKQKHDRVQKDEQSAQYDARRCAVCSIGCGEVLNRSA